MMPAGVHISVDTREFTETLRKYRQFSKRDNATICNTKAFYIARRATLETPKSNRQAIKTDLMEEIKTGGFSIVRKGRTLVVGAKGRVSSSIREKTAPLAALIINKARGAAGLPGLYGPKMRLAIMDLIKSRKVATLRAGWIPAIKMLEPLAEKRGMPKMDSSTKEFGRPKGSATPAKDGVLVETIIQNFAGAKWDQRDDATAKAAPALQLAFDAESRSMASYVERKQAESAQKAGIRTN